MNHLILTRVRIKTDQNSKATPRRGRVKWSLSTISTATLAIMEASTKSPYLRRAGGGALKNVFLTMQEGSFGPLHTKNELKSDVQQVADMLCSIPSAIRSQMEDFLKKKRKCVTYTEGIDRVIFPLLWISPPKPSLRTLWPQVRQPKTP